MLYDSLGIAIVTLATAATSGQEASYHYYRDRIALSVEPGRVLLVSRENPAGPGTVQRRHVIEERVIDGEAIPSAIDALHRTASDQFITPVFVDPRGNTMMVMPTAFIGFDPTTPEPIVREVIADAQIGHITHADYLGLGGVYRVASDTSDAIDFLDRLNGMLRHSFVRFAEPNLRATARPASTPDPLFCEQWGLDNTGLDCAGLPVPTADVDMNIPEAWTITQGHPSIITAVIDLGVELGHPDLAANLIPGIDVTNETDGSTPGPNDGSAEGPCDWHGTAVAGCIVAEAFNGIGVAGVAPETRVTPIRAFQVFPIVFPSACPSAFTAHSIINEVEWQAAALDKAVTLGARITNNSNDVSFFSALLSEKYIQTRDLGIIHFVAAGNDASTDLGFPGTAPAVNAIAAVARDESRWPGSNFGPDLDFAAPGGGILTTDITGDNGYCNLNDAPNVFGRAGCLSGANGDYAFIDGTSFASPYAAGVAALIMSYGIDLAEDSLPDLVVSSTTGNEVNAKQTEAILRFSSSASEPPVFNNDFGWGVVDAAAALVLLDECNLSLASIVPADDQDSNGLRDACEIIANPSLDCNENGLLDSTESGFVDCNNNGINDACDLFDLTSTDCNFDGIPDECQPDSNADGIIDACDCNNNGVLDSHDILIGTSFDCSTGVVFRDDVPDECTCYCNFNGDADVDVVDLTDFLAAWYALDPAADLACETTIPVVDVNDLLYFLTCWHPANVDTNPFCPQ